MIHTAGRILMLVSLTLFSSLPTFAGEGKLDLDQYKSQAVYVDFWASWCIPCKKSFPWMEAMQEKYKDKGLRIIAVNLDEDPAEADRFLQKYPVSFKIIRDPQGKLAQEYDIKGMPTALLFDASGKLISRHIGFRNDEKASYEAAIVKTLPATSSATH